MSATGRHIKTHVAQQVISCVKTFVGVALGEQRLNENAPLSFQLLLERVAFARH
jgi:hypothetical protein